MEERTARLVVRGYALWLLMPSLVAIALSVLAIRREGCGDFQMTCTASAVVVLMSLLWLLGGVLLWQFDFRKYAFALLILHSPFIALMATLFSDSGWLILGLILAFLISISGAYILTRPDVKVLFRNADKPVEGVKA